MFFVLPAVAYVILFVVFDMKLLFLVWRGHYMRQIDNPQDLRKKLTTFYIKFCTFKKLFRCWTFPLPFFQLLFRIRVMADNTNQSLHYPANYPQY